jgi:hypothetical protein
MQTALVECYGEMNCRVITLSGDLQSMYITTSSITEIEAGDDFANTAKTRLTNSVKTLVATKGYPWSLIANLIANAFIYHAEGDENDNAATQALLTGLTPYLSGANLSMAKSMLQDYSSLPVLPAYPRQNKAWSEKSDKKSLTY